MQTITHFITLTTGNSHRIHFTLSKSHGAPAPLDDYTIIGIIQQDGIALPISVSQMDDTRTILTLPPLIPGEHPYNITLQHKKSGMTHTIVQGNCLASELAYSNDLQTQSIETITAILNDDFSDINVTIHRQPYTPKQNDLDWKTIISNPSILQQLKNAFGITALEKELSAKANQADMETALADKVDIASLSTALSDKADISDLNKKADIDTLESYIPYTKLGDTFNRKTDGTIHVNLSNYNGDVKIQGETISIIGSITTTIGQPDKNSIVINSSSAHINHEKCVEMKCTNTLMNVKNGSFNMENKTADNKISQISSDKYNNININSGNDISLVSKYGCFPAIVISGAANGIHFMYNSTTTYDKIMWVGNTGLYINLYTSFNNNVTFNKYATFNAGHN